MSHDGYTDADLRARGWAPGFYNFRCLDCLVEAIGAKRSMRWRSCAAVALRVAEAAPKPAPVSTAVTRYAVRNAATGLLFRNQSMHPQRKSWDGLETAQVYLRRDAAEATAKQELQRWMHLRHAGLYPEAILPEVVEVELSIGDALPIRKDRGNPCGKSLAAWVSRKRAMGLAWGAVWVTAFPHPKIPER